MFSGFNHYLSYGSTDQQTMRELSGLYDGLLVPGTIAAFQAEGTKGFVLSLSARSGEPYVIDSRFPLFQGALPKAKKSHIMLAAILGIGGILALGRAPVPEDFNANVVDEAASRWLEFNTGYDEVRTKTFDKYATRLQEEVFVENRQAPAYILAPYLMLDDAGEWEAVDEAFWQAAQRHAERLGIRSKLRRVIASTSANKWESLAALSAETELIAWVSDLEEFRLDAKSERDLLDYTFAIRSAGSRGQSVFALYGGFFSVLLARFGLTGSSHGIGFGEHRDWIELPSSGAPPARYYMPRLHKYVSVDIADAFWRSDPSTMRCACEECAGVSPVSMDYHALMRHSVRMRHLEVAEWKDVSTSEVIRRLNYDFNLFRVALENLDAPQKVVRRAEGIHLHLLKWGRIMAATDSPT
jgi:hypothetical protein